METEERNSNRQERPQTRNVVFDHFDTELSRSQIIIRDFTEESNSTTANAFSDALVDAARKASSVKISGAKSSRTYVGEMAIALKKTHHSSSSNFNNDSRASGSSDDTGTGYSRNVVTATGTSTQTGTTTSSGDDGESSRELGSAVGSSENSTISSLFDLTHGRHRCQHHRSSRNNTATEPGAKLNESQGRLADGSGLQLPSYHGLDQFSTRPATVVASTIPPPNAGANSLSGNGGEAERDDLLQRHREPGYHTIRKTFSRLPKRNGSSFHRPTMETSSTKDHWMRKHIRDKYGYSISGCTSEGTPHANRKKKAIHCSNSNKDDAKPRRALPSSYFKDSNEGNGGGSSSGSGTEGGYLGSAESKENESSSSPSVSSSEDMSKGRRSLKDKAKTRAAAIKSRKEQADESGDSSSSEIADFSSGTTSDNGDDGEPRRYIMDPFHSTSPSLSSSNEDDGASSEDGYEATYIHARNQILQGQEDVMRATEKRRAIKETNVAKVTSWSKPQIPKVNDPSGFVHDLSRSPIMTVGSDIMAHVLTFLPPPVILDVLTMPLSKEWRQTFTFQPELWRVLCLVEPFKAEIDDKDDHDVDDSGSEDSFGSIHGDVEEKRSPMLEKYKLLYTSFVRCMKYLAQIREDALNGKAPSYIDYGIAGSNAQQELVGPNKNLQNFLTKARKCQGGLSSAESSSSEEPQQVVAGLVSILGDDTCRKVREESLEKKSYISIESDLTSFFLAETKQKWIKDGKETEDRKLHDYKQATWAIGVGRPRKSAVTMELRNLLHRELDGIFY